VAADVAALLAAAPLMARDLPAFDPDAAPDAPGELFVAWLADALRRGVPDAAAVTLSTADADGVPDARVVALRDVDVPGAGWAFEASAGSPKGRQLAENPVAALTWYWPACGRQVRIRGAVETVPGGVAAEAFRRRSPAGRVAGLVGRQSLPLPSLDAWESAAEEARRRLAADPGLVPEGHTRYLLRAREAEFWQGDRDRRHVRLRYTAAGLSVAGGRMWERSLLWP
jgi:pyridoxamine 5'-phosphate oxidase